MLFLPELLSNTDIFKFKYYYQQDSQLTSGQWSANDCRPPLQELVEILRFSAA